MTLATAALFAGAGTSTAAVMPSISVTSSTRDFSAIRSLKPLVGKGKGNITVILPDTASRRHYVKFDAPYLANAFKGAGMKSSQYRIENARGMGATQLSDAKAAISSGTTVLIVDPLDSGVGAQIESYAHSHRVKVIDYDRLTLGGSRTYYVSRNFVQIGQLLGHGLDRARPRGRRPPRR